MKKLTLILFMFLAACGGNVPVPPPASTLESYLQSMGTSCMNVTRFEDLGDGPPLCELVVKYQRMASDRMRTFLGNPGDFDKRIRLDNVSFIRKTRIYGHNYPDGNYVAFAGGPAIDLAYGVPGYPTPIYATIIRVGLTDNRPYHWKYELRYASEPSIYCEELHRIADEYKLPWWPHAGHYETDFADTHDDGLAFNCHDWAVGEYQRTHPNGT